MLTVARALRPWPKGKWSYETTWQNILLAHWPVSAQKMAPLLPLPPHLYAGSAWVTLLVCEVKSLSVRRHLHWPSSLPFPMVQTRTYVSHEGRHGVYDLSVDMGNRVAASIWRSLTGAPTHGAYSTVLEGDDATFIATERRGVLPISLSTRYAARGSPTQVAPGSLPDFLLERYYDYSDGPLGALMRAEVFHRPWPLRRVTVELQMTGLLPRRLEIREAPPLVNFCDELTFTSWPREQLFAPARPQKAPMTESWLRS